jgi:hypothetical protein
MVIGLPLTTIIETEAGASQTRKSPTLRLSANSRIAALRRASVSICGMRLSLSVAEGEGRQEGSAAAAGQTEAGAALWAAAASTP